MYVFLDSQFSLSSGSHAICSELKFHLAVKFCELQTKLTKLFVYLASSEKVVPFPTQFLFILCLSACGLPSTGSTSLIYDCLKVIGRV
jgi:hypothetical protein